LRIYIRQLKTKLFIGSSGGWQADGPHSRPFDSIVKAVDWVVENNITDDEIVLRFVEPRLDLMLPLPARKKAPPR